MPEQHSGAPRGFVEWVRVMRDAIFVAMGSIALLVFLLWVLRHVTSVVLVFLVALFFETLLVPLVDRMSDRWPRPLAVFVVLLGAIAVFGVGGTLVVSSLAVQLASLVQRLPQTFNALVSSFSGVLSWMNHLGVQINLVSIENRLLSQAGTISTAVFSRTFTVVSWLIGTVTDAVIVLFITTYLLVDAERIHHALFRLVPNAQRESALAIQHTFGRVVGGYVRAQVLLSVLVGGGFGLGCWLIGLPYPLVIGVLAALFELIPMLGPVLGAILPVLLAVFSNHPVVQVSEVGILLVGLQLLESQVLTPRLMRSQVGLHPILSVIALMTGAELGGLWGAVFAVPVAGITVAAWVGATHIWRERVVLPQNRRIPPS